MTQQIQDIWTTSQNNPTFFKTMPPKPNKPISYEQFLDQAQRSIIVWNKYIQNNEPETTIKQLIPILLKYNPPSIHTYIKQRKIIPSDF